MKLDGSAVAAFATASLGLRGASQAMPRCVDVRVLSGPFHK